MLPSAALRGRGRGRALLTLKIFSYSNHTIPQMAGLVPHIWLCAHEHSHEVLLLPAVHLIKCHELILGNISLVLFNPGTWHSLFLKHSFIICSGLGRILSRTVFYQMDNKRGRGKTTRFRSMPNSFLWGIVIKC